MANDAAPDVAVDTDVTIKAVPEPVPTKSLSQALILARRACRGTVHKGATNKAQGYSYVGHEQVLTSGARDALLSHDLTLEQRSVEYAGELTYSNRSGAALVWRWIGTFALVHASGEERAYRFEATTVPNDKAAFVASTALDRVAHLRILELAGSSDEDPEHDRNDERERREGQGAPQGGYQRPDRTADPPSNVRRLDAPSRGAESSVSREAMAMFQPKLDACRNSDELIRWGYAVHASTFPRPVKGQLTDMLRKRCARLNVDYEYIAEAITQGAQ